MKIKIPYDRSFIDMDVQDDRVAGILHPNKVPARDQAEVLEAAMKRPCGGPSLDEFLKEAKNLLIIVNDGTRPTPTSKVLDFLKEKLEGMDFKFIVATGIHRAPTREEFEFIFGPACYEKWRERIHVHDSRASQDMVFIGESAAGTKMRVNRMGVDAGAILVIGSVEPHYFGGYTGGRKSFLPGIASYETIEQNHKYAIRPEPASLKLKGNPVHEDMIDAIKTIETKPIFSIQTVLDRDRNIYAATAGDIHQSFDAAIEKSNDVFCVKIPEKCDVVVSAAPYPMDVDLYQSQKAIDNAKLALKEGGVLILVSKCRMGIGEASFFELMASSGTAKGILEKIDREYKLGYHKAAKLAEIALWAQMWAFTGLSDEEVSSVLMKPVKDLQAAVDDALKKRGEGAKVLFMMDGGVTVPLVEKQ
ncbi:MAG: nickel-dependent lactate racemase [Pseudomonadota bacterium]